MNNTQGKHTTKVRYLVDKISADISMGRYRVGTALPSINSMSAGYGVSRDTVFKALADLKERDVIDSIPGKGYFVMNREKNILLLLDEYSPFKDVLYNSLIERLPSSYKVDLWFHQYNEMMFNAIIRDSLGQYNRYLIMNFDNERMSSYINKIAPSRLLLLDFGKFDKNGSSYICQDFGESFYNAMTQLTARLKSYRRLVFFLPKKSKHPYETVEYFVRYCTDNAFEHAVVDTMAGRTIEKGDVMVAVRQTDIVECVKRGREEKMTCGRDYGVIAYNDTPAYQVIDCGITAVGIDWEEMGNMMADFILGNGTVQTYLPTQIHLRGSL